MTKGFKHLGNEHGTYMDADISLISTGRMFVSRILVSLNLKKGLSREIELTWGDRVFIQKLDYEGISFKFHRFHKNSHEANECNLRMA
jgi:hypothetical protein